MINSDEDDRWQRLRKLVARFPNRPGVYLMKSQQGTILYVGKAIDLRARVRSYLGGGDGRLQVPLLMSQVFDIEKIVCENENQALILERDLILVHKPRYNIKLKDDKSYLKVRIDRGQEWPRLETVRRERNDSADYFGPYVSSYQLKEVLDVIKRVIPLRTCSDAVFYNRQRPCLEYQIKRCCAPCCLKVDGAYYHDLVARAIAILEGRADKIIPELEAEMEAAAAELKFELAASLRDKIQQLESWVRGHTNVFHQGVDKHAFGLAREGSRAVINVLHTRRGRIAHSENYSFDDVAISDGELLESVVEQYYREGRSLPPEILVPLEKDLLGLLDEALELVGARQSLTTQVNVVYPQRGPRVRLLELAQLNAETHFNEVFLGDERHSEVVRRLQKLLSLKQAPRVIECMDISNLQGSNIVGAVIAFADGAPLKSAYRKYSLGTRVAPDDFLSIYEVTKRRLASGLEQQDLPDLLVIDGGRGQLGAALRARAELGVELDIVSIAKIRESVAGQSLPERLFVAGSDQALPLDADDSLTHFMQRLRDEVHRFVLSFHRQKRSNQMVHSALDSIPGIGPARRQRLLSHFGSRENIVSSSITEIAKVGRMSPLVAEKLVRMLQQQVLSADD